jgi:hypothetical protein
VVQDSSSADLERIAAAHEAVEQHAVGKAVIEVTAP